MNSRALAPLTALVLALAACAPPAPQTPAAGAPQPGDLVGGGSVGTLVEREPDLCRAADYQRYVGQPGSVVAGLGIARVYRVVEFGGIVTQEYDPARLNFNLDPSGVIVRVACG